MAESKKLSVRVSDEVFSALEGESERLGVRVSQVVQGVLATALLGEGVPEPKGIAEVHESDRPTARVAERIQSSDEVSAALAKRLERFGG